MNNILAAAGRTQKSGGLGLPRSPAGQWQGAPPGCGSALGSPPQTESLLQGGAFKAPDTPFPEETPFAVPLLKIWKSQPCLFSQNNMLWDSYTLPPLPPMDFVISQPQACLHPYPPHRQMTQYPSPVSFQMGRYSSCCTSSIISNPLPAPPF